VAKSMESGRRWLFLLLLLAAVLGRFGGSWLVVDGPQPADAIVVLAGETEQRPAKGLQMLALGLAPRMVLDAPAGTHVYRWSQLELAQQYLGGLPESPKLTPCPILGLSTRDEARDVAHCLAALAGTSPGGAAYGVHRVLLVTSDYHTRRALAIFRHEIPGVQFSAAAAYDPAQYGPKWWQHRQWAKTFFDECVRLVWWYAVDRWR
jgi:uncharacterized SAM-binding protein YcdF (DUF218 family)